MKKVLQLTTLVIVVIMFGWFIGGVMVGRDLGKIWPYLGAGFLLMAIAVNAITYLIARKK